MACAVHSGAGVMPDPRVSVILPVYNRDELLKRAALSVLNQDYRDLELIIVDDGSSEDLRPVVDALGDSRVRYLRREHNGGVAAARNSGLQLARGEFIAFQDSDDLWLAGKLGKQVAALSAAEPDVGLVYTDIRRQHGEHAFIFPDSRLPVREGDLRDIVFGEGHLCAFTQTWLVRARLLNEVGEFDPALRLWEDWDLCIRLAQRGKFAYLPGVTVVSSRVADSITLDDRLWLPAQRHIAKKYARELQRGGPHIARFYYRLARLAFLHSQRAEGRRACWRSLGAKPSFKAAALTLLAVIGLERRMLKAADMDWRTRRRTQQDNARAEPS